MSQNYRIDMLATHRRPVIRMPPIRQGRKLATSSVIGDALRSRTDRTEATEVGIAAAALNRMLAFGRPNYVRIA